MKGIYVQTRDQPEHDERRDHHRGNNGKHVHYRSGDDLVHRHASGPVEEASDEELGVVS